MDRETYIESKIAEYKRDNPWIEDNAHALGTLRSMLLAEDKFWERYEGREEEGHSNSCVGDNYNRT